MSEEKSLATGERSEGRESYDSAMARITELFRDLYQWLEIVNSSPVSIECKKRLFDLLHGGMHTHWQQAPDSFLSGQNCLLTYSHHENSEGSLYVTFEHNGQQHTLRFRWLGEDWKCGVTIDDQWQVGWNQCEDERYKHWRERSVELRAADRFGTSPSEINDDGIQTAKSAEYDPHRNDEFHRLCNLRDSLFMSICDVVSRLFTLGKSSPRSAIQIEINEAFRKVCADSIRYENTSFAEIVPILHTIIVGLEQALPELDKLLKITGCLPEDTSSATPSMTAIDRLKY